MQPRQELLPRHDARAELLQILIRDLAIDEVESAAPAPFAQGCERGFGGIVTFENMLSPKNAAPKDNP